MHLEVDPGLVTVTGPRLREAVGLVVEDAERLAGMLEAGALAHLQMEDTIVRGRG